MILNIILDDRILKRTSNIRLPDFTILTGSNGAGKTQLLRYIRDYSNGSQLTNELGEFVYDTDGAVKNVFPLLTDDNKPLVDIQYSNPGLQKSEYDVSLDGNSLLQTIRTQWNEIDLIVLAYHSLREKVFLDETSELQEITSAVMNFVTKAIQPSQYGNSLPNLKSIQLHQLQRIKSIAESTGKHPGDLRLIDLIAFYDIPLDLFSSALDLLFHQFFLKRKYYPHLTNGITPPWDIFNDILKRADFPYRSIYNESHNDELPLPVRLIDNDNGNQINFEDLSSGETTIMRLIFALYNSSNKIRFPQVILFDEPDAHLHPSLTQTFLDVIQGVLIKENKTKIILTTHSPSTVALAPPDSIYIMDRKLGRPIQGNQKDALGILSNGMSAMTIQETDLGIAFNINNTLKHIIFTEGVTDKIILDIAWKKLFPERQCPFFIQDCFDAAFLGNLFSRGNQPPDGIFQQFPEKKMIAIFDFDGSGYSNWDRDKKTLKDFETDPRKGLAKSSGNNDLRILLPVPQVPQITEQVMNPNGGTYRDKSHMTIESLLFDVPILNDFFTEEAVTGGGQIYKVKDNSKRQISAVINTLSKSDFKHFHALFDTILRFLE